MLTCGDVEGGIEHLGNAVAVCGQPAQLLQVLQKTLPPQIFHLLLQRLQPISQVCIRTNFLIGAMKGENLVSHLLLQKLSTHIAMAEEDVE